MRAPRVSIVMPVYNSRPELFRRTFPALLAQTFGDFELILSDNGSSSEARSMYEDAAQSDPRVRYLRHDRNYGAELNFNYAFGATTGAYFMWSADDDVRHVDYLARTVELLDRRADAVSAGSHVVIVNDAYERVGVERFPSNMDSPRVWERVALPRQASPADFLDFYALHRRATVARTHMNRTMHEGDTAFVRDVLLQGPIARVPEELFSFRTHAAYDGAGLSSVMLGSQSRRVIYRYPTQHLALELLVAALTNDAPISDAERAVAVLALAGSLMRRGAFTRDAYSVHWATAKAALRERRFADAAVPLMRAMSLSPSTMFDADAWARLLDPKRVRSFIDRAGAERTSPSPPVVGSRP